MRFLVIVIVMVMFSALSCGLFAQDAENVEQVGRIYNYWDRAIDVIVRGDLAYVATGYSGLQILDISDQENPELVGYWDDNQGGASSIAISGDYIFLAEYNNRDFSIVSVADPRNPELVGFYDTPGDERYVDDFRDIAVFDDHIYIADGFEGLRIFNISELDNPEEVGHYQTGERAYAVSIYGNYALVAATPEHNGQ